jgi:hypothetical protein
MFDYNDLDYCTGTEHYYKAPLIWFKYTDGVKYVAHNGGAWLIQDISLFTAKHQNDDFICVDCKFNGKGADIHFSDGNGNEWRKYHVAHTPDFGKGEIKFFIIDGICLLASEY